MKGKKNKKNKKIKKNQCIHFTKISSCSLLIPNYSSTVAEWVRASALSHSEWTVPSWGY